MPIFEVTFQLTVDETVNRDDIQTWANHVVDKFREEGDDWIKIIFLDEKGKEFVEDEDTLWRKDK